MTQNVGELARTIQNEVEVLKPYDQQILGGVALSGMLGDQNVMLAVEKLQTSFDRLREEPFVETRMAAEKNCKPQTEFGYCIAYSIPQISDEETAVIDGYFINLAKRQNHGMRTTENKPVSAPNTEVMWSGFDPASKQELVLYKRTGLIMLSNLIPHDGLLYALKSKVVDDKPSWGWM